MLEKVQFISCDKLMWGQGVGWGQQITAVFLADSDQSHPFTLHTVYVCFIATMANLSNSNQDHRATKPKTFTVCPLHRKSVDLWLREVSVSLDANLYMEMSANKENLGS